MLLGANEVHTLYQFSETYILLISFRLVVFLSWSGIIELHAPLNEILHDKSSELWPIDVPVSCYRDSTGQI